MQTRRPSYGGADPPTLSLQAYTLTLPSLIRLSDLMRPLEPDALVAARKFVKQARRREYAE